MLAICLLSLLMVGSMKASEAPILSAPSEAEVALQDAGIFDNGLYYCRSLGYPHVLNIKNNSNKPILVKANVVSNAAPFASVIADFNFRMSAFAALVLGGAVVSGLWAYHELAKPDRWWANYFAPVTGLGLNIFALPGIYKLYSAKKYTLENGLQKDMFLAPGETAKKLFWLHDQASNADIDRSAILFVE